MKSPLVKVEGQGRVGVLKIEGPKAVNALSNEVIDELAQTMRAFDVDDNIGAIVLTGSEKAFVAGADIGAMQGWRSEEHTSELQSLMRNSYAVLCLKTKKWNPITVLKHTH